MLQRNWQGNGGPEKSRIDIILDNSLNEAYSIWREGTT